MAARDSPDHAAALFACSWQLLDGSVHCFPLPPALTGIAPTVLVLAGEHFALGSCRTAVAWSTWLEHTLAGAPPPARPAPGRMARAFDWVAARIGRSWGDGPPLNPAEAWAGYRYHTHATAAALREVFAAWSPDGEHVVVSGCDAAGAFQAIDALPASTRLLRVSRSAPTRATRVEDRVSACVWPSPEAAAAWARVLTSAPGTWSMRLDADPVEAAAMVGRLGPAACAQLLAAREAAHRWALGAGDLVVLVSAEGPDERPGPTDVANASDVETAFAALETCVSGWRDGGCGEAGASREQRAAARERVAEIDARLQAERG
jgi:hypothetical protein